MFNVDWQLRSAKIMMLSEKKTKRKQHLETSINKL